MDGEEHGMRGDRGKGFAGTHAVDPPCVGVDEKDAQRTDPTVAAVRRDGFDRG